MELSTNFCVSLIFASLLVPLAKLCWDLCFPRMTIEDEKNAQIFTRLLLTQKFINSDCQKVLPTEGAHLFWFREVYPVYCHMKKRGHNPQETTGPVLTYSLTTLPFCFHVFEQLRKELTPQPPVLNSVYRPSGSNFKKTAVKMPLHANAFQRSMFEAFDQWSGAAEFSCVALLCGKAGAGKSKCARMLSKHIRTRYGRESEVFENLNIMAQEFDLMRLVARGKHVQILLFDEIDIAFENAAAETADKRQRNLTKIEICNFLDTFSDLVNVIVIFTTNLSLQEMEEKYGVYIRPGRVDLKLEAV